MEAGRKGSFAAKPLPIMGGHYDSGEVCVLNVLTWNEFGGLRNLTKCEEIMVSGGNFAGGTS